jgi:hypothetical protein
MISAEAKMPDTEIDLRKYAATTNRWLLAGGLLVIVLGGLALIYVIFGQYSAIMAALCFAGLFVPVLMIVGFLALLQWIVRRSGRGDDID